MFRERFHSHFIVFVGSGKGLPGALLITRLLLATTPWSRTLPVITIPPRYIRRGSHVSACFQVKREKKDRHMEGTTLGEGQNWSS